MKNEQKNSRTASDARRVTVFSFTGTDPVFFGVCAMNRA